MPKDISKRKPDNLNDKIDSTSVNPVRKDSFEVWISDSNSEFERLQVFLLAIDNKEDTNLFSAEEFKNILTSVEDVLCNAGFITRRGYKWELDDVGCELVEKMTLSDTDWELYCLGILGKVVGLSNLHADGHDFCVVKDSGMFTATEDSGLYSYGIFLYLLGLVTSYDDKMPIQEDKTRQVKFALTACGKRVYKRLCNRTPTRLVEEVQVPEEITEDESKNNRTPVLLIIVAVVFVIVVVIGLVFAYKTNETPGSDGFNIDVWRDFFHFDYFRERPAIENAPESTVSVPELRE